MPTTFNNRILYSNPSAGQCNWDYDWYRNNRINAALLPPGLDGNYIISGGLTSVGVGLSVDIDEIVCVVDGNEFTVTAGNYPLTGATTEAEEINFIWVDSSGVAQVTIDEPNETCALISIVDTDVTQVLRITDGRQMEVVPDIPAVAARKNLIINGKFDVWQRGTALSGVGFVCDRWYANIIGDAALSVQQSDLQATDNPYEDNLYFMATTFTEGVATNSLALLRYSIEDVNTAQGQTVTTSIRVFASVGGVQFSTEFQQYFGSGGGGSVTELGVEKFTCVQGWNTFTKTVTLPSTKGIVVAAGSNLRLNIWLTAGPDYDARNDSLGHQTGALTFAHVQIEKGDTATDFEYRSYGEELALCQRYYEQFASSSVLAVGHSVNTTLNYWSLRYVTKRTLPTVYVPPTGVLVYSGGGVPQTSTSNDATFAQVSSVRIGSTVGASLVSGNAGYIRTNGIITVDAEL